MTGHPPDGGSGDAGAAACLILVARLHGIRVAPHQLRGLTADWTNAEAVLAGIGFRGRTLTSAEDQLAEIARAVPAIVRLRDGRHLVLTGVGEGPDGPDVTLVDPARDDGRMTILRAAFMPAWSGQVVLLKPDRQNPVSGGTRFGWTALATFVWRDGRLARDLLLATLASGGLALGPILFARSLADDTVTALTPNTFWALTLGVAVLVGFEWGFAVLRHMLVTRIAARLDLGLDRLAFQRALGLPLGTFESTPVAALARGVDAARSLAAELPGMAARTALDAGVALVLLVVLVATSLVLATLAVALTGLGALVLLLLARRQGRATAARADAAAVADDRLTEAVAGFAAIRALALEARERRRWDMLVARMARLDILAGDAAGRTEVAASLLAALVAFGPFALGVALSIAGVTALSRTDLFVVLLVCIRLAAPLRDIVPLVDLVQRSRSALASLRDLVEAAPEVERGRPGLQSPLTGEFAFSAVRYTYPGALVPALEAVSFEVPAGSVFGIMGRSGAGKSTIARLLYRAGGDHEGLVKLDGVDVRQFDLDHLRRSVLVLDGGGRLFAGTVRANLELGLGSMADEAVLAALRVAGLEEEVARLPAGLATMLSETAPILSDGQRQRLAIARAVLADPAILVLDEATSAIDGAGEAVLLASLRRVQPARTLVIISQRLTAVARADAILVLDRGEVQDIGRHGELVGRSDLYSGMWRRQSSRLRLAHRSDPVLPGPSSHVA